MIVMIYDLEKLKSLLPASGNFSGERMYYFEEIDSTNSWLLGQNDTGGKFCLAAQQLQGRGRRGRSWVSEPGSSVLLSMGWSPPLPGVAGISLVSGLAVVAALEAQGVNNLQLKWPNDIILESKKLGGILVEVAGNSLVIGVGLNVDLNIDKGIDQPWTDLYRCGYLVNKEQLVADLLIMHHSMLEDCQNLGFGAFRERWNQLHGYRDQLVTSVAANNIIEGYARGVDESGALLVETNLRMERIISGEVSLRLSIDPALETPRSGP
jgi:BirA family biotin operon repressor/biotin-[acetyl-CoA-carboxylase] ligase